MIKGNQHTSFAIITKAVLFCAISTGVLWLSLLITSSIPALSKNFLSSTIGPILILLITYLFLKFDKKSWSGIGLKFDRFTISKFFIGFFMGIAIMSIFILSIVYASGFHVLLLKNSNILFLLLTVLPTIILLAWMEEIIFRAYPLIILKNKTGILTALIITSIMFGLYHVVFGWGVKGFIYTSIWGLAFGLLAIYSNGISMPTGFHAAGNLLQAAFGLTGNSLGIWNIVSIKGQHVNDFSNNSKTIIIAQIILLILICICIKLMLSNKKNKP